ncbi:MAG: DNA polymerase III subunit gamma/tau [Clostridia bacterium]|nr:DNA polymerase III subunit gamma/tau [Clostridia bacterium]
MEHISLYRRFRPSTFDKVIGQRHVVRTLTNQIKTNRVGHAYLFTGTRGTGKTSCAKIFARAVNCLRPVDGSPCGECEVCRALDSGASIDIIEMDAASNNRVDEIRDLKENVQYRPTVGKYKVYIIDEVHMLTTSAFNALLKTLEEPPEYVIFILATTEVQKLPQTILSRCMRFDFRLVSKEELVGLLKRIFDEMNVKYDERALQLIAVAGEGSVRDTLSVADMCLSYGGDEITYEDALEITATTSYDTLEELAFDILDGRVGDALNTTDRLLSLGRTTLSKDLASYFGELITIKNVPSYTPDGLTAEQVERLDKKLVGYTNYRLARTMDVMCALEGDLRYSTQPKVLFEAAIVKCCELTTEINIDGLTGRIKDLEKKLADLEKNGVRVPENAISATVIKEQTDTVPARQTPEDTKEKPPKSKLDDVNELLTKVAERQVEVVFEETNKEEDESSVYLAGEIWGRVLMRLSDSDEMMLKMAASCVEGGYKIVDNDFILETADNATYNIFIREEYRAVMQKLIREESGTDYTFVCVRAKEKEESVRPEDRLTLDRLFNGEIKIRPKK